MRRQDITLTLADEFWKRCNDRACHLRAARRRPRLEPAVLRRCPSPPCSASATAASPWAAWFRSRPTRSSPASRAIDEVRDRGTQLHLLGITRCDDIPTFASHGVTSFDSTSPFRQAFKDDRDNYYTADSTYIALRVPQVEGNVKLRKRISSGEIDQKRALTLERTALRPAPRI